MGKHPAAKDYVRIGAQSPLMEAVGSWAVKGYDKLSPAKEQNQQMHSWRFWLQGGKKGTLICGLGRDSSDSIGRPYPIFIMGEGVLKGWTKNWTQLTSQLNAVWKSMESLIARRFDDIRVLEEEVLNLNPPPEKVNNSIAPEGETVSCEKELTACRQSIAEKGYGMIRLNSCEGDNPHSTAGHIHARLHECCKKAPLGVFLGGTPQKSHIFVLERPMNTEDFVRLWTV